MMKRSTVTVLAAVLAVAASLAVRAQAPASEVPPSEKNPMRFRAFAVNMNGGRAGTLDIVIERWTTDAERNMLIGLVAKTTPRPDSQTPLLEALQDIKPRTGFIRTSNSLGWDLKYAYQRPLPEGGRQIVIATDKPVSFLAAYSSARTLDYPFTFVEMRFPKDSNEGEGKLLNQTSIAVKDGRLELELYGREPTRLTQITLQKRK